ncbi:MAG: hypothetical protein OEZ08_01590 [Betaproteobacteria bacterium]|nr:hypothetical protein [Betaproteobacteria bacterium]
MSARSGLAIILPTHPRKRAISGHITSWNASLICNNLVFSEFSPREAQVMQTREPSVIVSSRTQGAGVQAAAAYGCIGDGRADSPFPLPTTTRPTCSRRIGGQER